jgi:hypothetical protein
LLLIVGEKGEAILAPAITKAFQPASRARLLPGIIRSYPAIADGRLYVRNEQQLAAYEAPGL